MVRKAMIGRAMLKTAVLGAGIFILLTGLVLAQTPPAPPPAPQAEPQANAPAANAPTTDRRDAMRGFASACRSEIGDTARGQDRREAMRKCMEAKRESAGLNQRGDRQAGREAQKADRQAHMRACRDELKDQRFSDGERRSAMRDCISKKDPRLAKQLACRQEAETKKLEAKTREFRQFMRECRERA